jgi:hypothetical protein
MFQKNQARAQLSKLSQKRYELLQLSRRLKDLLPKRLELVKSQYQQDNRPGKSLRLALQDKKYLEYLNEFLEISYQYRQITVKWEVTKMKLLLSNTTFSYKN